MLSLLIDLSFYIDEAIHMKEKFENGVTVPEEKIEMLRFTDMFFWQK